MTKKVQNSMTIDRNVELPDRNFSWQGHNLESSGPRHSIPRRSGLFSC